MLALETPSRSFPRLLLSRRRQPLELSQTPFSLKPPCPRVEAVKGICNYSGLLLKLFYAPGMYLFACSDFRSMDNAQVSLRVTGVFKSWPATSESGSERQERVWVGSHTQRCLPCRRKHYPQRFAEGFMPSLPCRLRHSLLHLHIQRVLAEVPCCVQRYTVFGDTNEAFAHMDLTF